ncbi:Glycosyl hydrolases family 31 protein [Prunus dulcis]|uniref:Glycosyl hydrolases family 31 protein n=1 Tax=Prunus dulcis TaxID=3755 RepID=A0A4Y1QPM6_PRUDU|nr:Glycosyl hydrolases family 31 protein [Prunus dulcis]
MRWRVGKEDQISDFRKDGWWDVDKLRSVLSEEMVQSLLWLSSEIIITAAQAWFKAFIPTRKAVEKMHVSLTWSPHVHGVFKLNMDGSHRVASSCIGARGILHKGISNLIIEMDYAMALKASKRFKSFHGIKSLRLIVFNPSSIFSFLDRDNCPTWLAQIVPVLHSHRLLLYVDGSCPSPSPSIPNPKAKESDSSPSSLISNPTMRTGFKKISLFSLLSMILFIIKFLLPLLPKPPHVTLGWHLKLVSLLLIKIIFFNFATICSAQPVVILPLHIFLDRIHSITNNLALGGAPVHESDLLVVVMNNVGAALVIMAASLTMLWIVVPRSLLRVLLRRHQNQGVLGPPPSGPHNSSFGSHSFPRGPLQCYNCRGYGHVDAVCPSEATFVPAPSIRLQGITSHHLSHGGTQQWVGDTRANTHITNDLSHISRAREYHGSDNVGVVLGGTGYSLNHQACRCLDLSSYRVFLSRHVLFDELSFPFHKASAALAPDSSPSSSTNLPLLLHRPNFSSRSSVSSNLTPPTSQAQPSLPAPAFAPPAPCPLLLLAHHLCHPLYPKSTLSSPPCQPRVNLFAPKIVFPHAVHVPFSTSSPPSDTSLVNVSNTHLMATRAKASVRKPNPKYAHHVLVSTDDYFELTSFSQANKLKEWRLAMADEFNALLCARTWTLVPHTLAMNVLPNKWVFLFNRNSDGTIQHYKARFVTNGFHQQPGLDYGETFSPVANNSTILLILALSVQFSWHVRQLDVHNVFLHGYLDEEVYIHQPVGFVDPTYPDHSDSSLFVYTQGSIHIYLLIYVDDILVTGSDLSRITTLISDLGRRFSMKDLVSAHYFLGMELLHTPSGFSLTQTK